MNKYLLAIAAVSVVAGTAGAGGLDRSQQSTTYLYGGEGTTFTIAAANPTLNGTDDPGQGNGDYQVGESFTQIGATAVINHNEGLTFGFQFDQPYGGIVSYGGDPATAALAGTGADFGTDSLNFLARYQIDDNWSVFGGVRLQRSAGEVSLGGRAYSNAALLGSNAFLAGTRASIANNAALGPLAGVVSANITDGTIRKASVGDPSAVAEIEAINPALVGAGAAVAGSIQNGFNTTSTVLASNGVYNVDIDDSLGWGYSLGAAYEIPRIALRLQVTYHSAVDHTSDTVENQGNPFVPGGPPTVTVSEVDYTTPQSFNIDFQTGIAEDTLLTATFRWAEWGSFDVIPTALGSDLADLDDSYRYGLGIARRINDELAISAGITYEEASGDDNVSPLTPTDGETGINVGVRYDNGDGLVISGGLGYVMLGDADAGVLDRDVASFTDNTVTTVGLRVSFSF